MRRLLVALIRRRGHEAVVLDADVVVPPRADVLLVDPVAPASAAHARLARELFPSMPIVCLNPLPYGGRIPGSGMVEFLQKPFVPEALDAAIDAALDVAA